MAVGHPGPVYGAVISGCGADRTGGCPEISNGFLGEYRVPAEPAAAPRTGSPARLHPRPVASATRRLGYCGIDGTGYREPDPLSDGVPSIYSIVPPNYGSALRHGHHFEPVDFVIDHGRGHHDAYSAGSCLRTYARAYGCRQRSTSPQRGIDRIRAAVVRPRGVRNDDADRRPWARKRPFRTRPAERVVHPVCPCRSTGGSLNRDNSRGMSQECAANAAR